MLTYLIPALVLLLFIAAFILFRTALFSSAEEAVEPLPPADVDSHTVAEHLGRLVRCQTISWPEASRFDPEAFHELHRELISMYPRTHRVLTVEYVGQYSLLYTWQGKDPELKPVLLMSHQDVVPVEAGSEKDWEHPPFAGEIADGYVWGRGTMDVKGGITAIMESVECLLQDGFRPNRTVYLAFGHDEELSGKEGTGQIVALLQKRGVELDTVLDEGGAIVTGVIPGIERPVALVGIAEKGYISLELSCDSPGGHSSAPPAVTAIGRLSRAVHRLETHPMPARLASVRRLFSRLASDLPYPMRIGLANLWLFGGVVQRRLSATPSTNAMIRTTTAPTVIHAGVKDNILPRQASAVVNFRILPGDTVQDVVEHVRRVVADEGIKLRGFNETALPAVSSAAAPVEQDWGGRATSPICDADGPAFQLLAHTVRQVFPEAAVVPALVLGATDSRYYAPICDQILRFMPVRYSQGDLGRAHGVNERLSLKNCGDMVRFYMQWVRQVAGE